MKFLLCEKCKKAGFVKPSACCFGSYPEAGDNIEFLSDKQTEKGPIAGIISISTGNRILVKHSDSSEEFCVDELLINKKTRHRKGGRLWVCA